MATGRIAKVMTGVGLGLGSLSGEASSGQEPVPPVPPVQGSPAPSSVEPTLQAPVVVSSPQGEPCAPACLASPQSVCATGQASLPMISLNQLVRMTPQELDQLYMQSPAGSLPPGKSRGRLILSPGTRLAVPASKMARAVWQGKVVSEDGTALVNRFFGMKLIRAEVSYGASWLDGKPSIIVDYQNTSWLYRPYRDEVREVAPGVYLGLMYTRTEPTPTLKTYFALEAIRQ